MRQTILLADDSPTIQRLVTNTFADVAFDIVSVSNGEAAIRKFEETHPSVVLADIYMPGKNGYEVCAYVKKHAFLGKTPVVLLVGAFDAFDEQRANQAGAAASITKPFEPQALVDLVQSVLETAQQEAVRVAAAYSPELPGPSLESPGEVLSPVIASDDEMGGDLLGLEALFKDPKSDASSSAAAITSEDIDRIADRVIERLSTEIIQNIAWDIVPDIAEKVVREELKRIDES
jgi:CheY-like chemotaxis protein